MAAKRMVGMLDDGAPSPEELWAQAKSDVAAQRGDLQRQARLLDSRGVKLQIVWSSVSAAIVLVDQLFLKR